MRCSRTRAQPERGSATSSSRGSSVASEAFRLHRTHNVHEARLCGGRQHARGGLESVRVTRRLLRTRVREYKKGLADRVPLSPQAVSILKQLQAMAAKKAKRRRPTDPTGCFPARAKPGRT